MKAIYTFLFLLLSLAALTAYAQPGHDSHRRRRPPYGMVITDPNVHDPVMAMEDSSYYIYYTGPNVGVYESKDLTHWTIMPNAFRTAPEWAIDSIHGYRGHTWAPDIVKKDSVYHMFYSCSTFGKNTSAIGHAWATTLHTTDSTGTWHDTGAVLFSHEGDDDFNAIDPSVAIDEDGVAWMAFGSFWGGIQFVRLTSDLTQVDKSYQQKIIATRRQGKAIEAPFLYRHGNFWYLFVSWDYCCRGERSDYKVVVGRSASIEGPYIDADGVRMDKGGGTIVFTGNDRFVAGGHSATYTFGDKDIFICHGYTEDNDSRLFMSEMKWEADWPILISPHIR